MWTDEYDIRHQLVSCVCPVVLSFPFPEVEITAINHKITLQACVRFYVRVSE